MLARDDAPVRGASRSSMCCCQRVVQTGSVAVRGNMETALDWVSTC